MSEVLPGESNLRHFYRAADKHKQDVLRSLGSANSHNGTQPNEFEVMSVLYGSPLRSLSVDIMVSEKNPEVAEQLINELELMLESEKFDKKEALEKANRAVRLATCAEDGSSLVKVRNFINSMQKSEI